MPIQTKDINTFQCLHCKNSNKACIYLDKSRKQNKKNDKKIIMLIIIIKHIHTVELSD